MWHVFGIVMRYNRWVGKAVNPIAWPSPGMLKADE